MPTKKIFAVENDKQNLLDTITNMVVRLNQIQTQMNGNPNDNQRNLAIRDLAIGMERILKYISRTYRE